MDLRARRDDRLALMRGRGHGVTTVTPIIYSNNEIKHQPNRYGFLQRRYNQDVVMSNRTYIVRPNALPSLQHLGMHFGASK